MITSVARMNKHRIHAVINDCDVDALMLIVLLVLFFVEMILMYDVR